MKENVVFEKSKKFSLRMIKLSLKETAETLYWLELLKGSEYISEREFNSLAGDCIELQKLLSSITKTSQQSLEN